MERLVGARRQIVLQFERTLRRGSSLAVLAAATGTATVVALFAVLEAGPGVYAPLVYFGLPLGLAPVCAYRAARERERGLEAILATTPSRPGLMLAGRLAAWATALAVALLVTASIHLLLVDLSLATSFDRILPFLAWGSVLGLSSIVAGLLVGTLWGETEHQALTAALVLVATWVVLATKRAAILSLAGSETQARVLLGIVHASPLTWALEAQAGAPLALVEQHWRLLGGLGLLVLVGLLALAVVVVARRHGRGGERWWARGLPGVALAVALLGALALLGTIESTMPPPGPDTAASAAADPLQGETMTVERLITPGVGALATLGLAGAARVLPTRWNAW